MTPQYQNSRGKKLKSIEDVFNFKGNTGNVAKKENNKEFLVRGAQSKIVEAPKVI